MYQASFLGSQHTLVKILLSFIVTIVTIKTLAVFFYDRAPFCSLTELDIHNTTECPVQEPIVRTVTLSFEERIQALFHQRKALVDDPYFVDRFGTNHTLPEEVAFTEPMGSKLCIVDIDTRELEEPGYLLSPEGINWNKLHYTSAGMLNHYIYALIHGYTYKFIRTQPLPDRAVFWTKIPALAETLDECDLTVSIDADATFMNLNLPFEWLLNRWGTTRNTSLTMARDPDQPQNYDSARQNILLNCGFVIAQSLPRTQEILAAWASCPDDETKYPDCSRWKNPWPAEQAAFGEYIRYEFEEPDDIRQIDCNDANGFPEANQGCEGLFIRHHWSRKDLVLTMLVDSWMHASMDIFQDRFMSKIDQMVVVKEALEIPEESELPELSELSEVLEASEESLPDDF